MVLPNDIFWIRCSGMLWVVGSGCEWSTWRRQYWSIIVRLEHIQSFQLLIQNCQRLEPLRLIHLRFEPILHFVLPIIFQVLMYVIEMPAIVLTTHCGKGSLKAKKYLLSCSNVNCGIVSNYQE